MPARALSFLFAIPLLSVAVAQDMVAVQWSGQILALDSFTGATWPLGVGLAGQNALARDANGVLWSNGFLSPASVRGLTRLDPAAGTATAVHVSDDIRALAAGPGTTLYAVLYESNANRFCHIDSATGVHTLVGAPFAAGVQGMTSHNGVLFAWNINQGLATIDPSTGVVTDLASGGSAYIQWLATRPDGQLIGGGGDQLFTIDVVSGLPTPYAQTASDVRGAEVSGFALPYGQGCFGGTDTVTLDASGPLVGGSLLTVRSTGHSVSGAIFASAGILVVGTSMSTHAGLALPLSLDPIFGTANCSLLASLDATAYGAIVSTWPPHMQFVLALPAAIANETFFLQSIGLDPVPGNLSVSNGLRVRVGD